MLNKKLRLRKRTEFAFSYKHGKHTFGEFVNIVVFQRKDKLLRIGFSVSKKIGKAVKRNLVRRRIQAIVREISPNLARGYNLVIVAKTGIENTDFVALKSSLIRQFCKVGLICK